MSYSIVLKKTGEVFGLNDEDGQSLQEAWEGAKRPFVVRLGSDSVMSNEIARISKNKEQNSWLTQDIVDAANRSTKLPAGNKCRATQSIQREIMRRANKKKEWKQLADPAYREQMRQDILAEDTKKKWCDSKTGSCACPKEPANATQQPARPYKEN